MIKVLFRLTKTNRLVIHQYHNTSPPSRSKKDPNNSPRAIIPMRGNSAGDPNELSSNGTEWANVEDIQAMQAECEGNATIVPAGGK